MFAGLRRYQKFIWPVVAIMIIPLFITFFSPGKGSNFSQSEASYDLGRLNGEPITLSQYQDAQREAFFRMRFYGGQWPDGSSEQFQDFTYNVILINQQIAEHGIHPSPEAIARVAMSFGIPDIAKFMDSVPKRVVHVTKADLVRFLEHEAGFRELTQLITAASQLVPPREVEEKFRKQNAEAIAEAVFFSGQSYTNSVAVTPEALGRHYTNYQSNYRLQERLQVSYATFPKGNYFPQAEQRLTSQTNLAKIIDEAYQRQGATNFTDPKNPSVLLSEADAKAKIRNEFRDRIALTFAYNAASEVADKMMNDTNRTVQFFESHLNGLKITTQTSAPFERSSAPVELNGVTSEFSSKIFQLTNASDAILFSPVMGEDAAYLTAVKRRMPSQVEPFEVVRSRVVADFLRNQGRDLASQAGTTFYSTLTNQLAAGKSFAEVAAASRLKVETLPPFSLATESLPELEGRIELSQLKNAVNTLSNGGVSRFIYSRDGGAIVRLRERRPVSDEVRKEQYAQFLQRERSGKMNDSLVRWFQKIEQERLVRPASARQDGDESKAPASKSGATRPAAPKAKS